MKNKSREEAEMTTQRMGVCVGKNMNVRTVRDCVVLLTVSIVHKNGRIEREKYLMSVALNIHSTHLCIPYSTARTLCVYSENGEIN